METRYTGVKHIGELTIVSVENGLVEKAAQRTNGMRDEDERSHSFYSSLFYLAKERTYEDLIDCVKTC